MFRRAVARSSLLRSGGSRRLAISSGAVALLLALALFGPALAPYDPAHPYLERRLEGPSLEHPFGLDELGRDILARLLVGARVSIAAAIAVVGTAAAIGIVLGGLAAARGGVADLALMRVADVLLAFPGVLLAIALVAVLGPSLRHVVLALIAIGWVSYARLARGQVLRLREQDFVLAARAAGAGGLRVFFRHLLPNVLPVLVVQAALGTAGVILAEASLSFLGLGVQPPTPSWGAMLAAGRLHLLDAPHLTVVPGTALAATVFAINAFGDALLERLDPRAASELAR